MTPFWDPNFSPPCGQLAAPYLNAHEESGPTFQVVHSDMGPRSCLLLCEPLASPCWRITRGNDANFGDFGIMTPLDEPVVP